MLETGARHPTGDVAAAGCQIDPELQALIAGSLASILQTPKFVANASPRKMLEYVVAETLAGRGAQIRAYSVGTQALGRREAFDPRSDSLVRVEAMRLRALLDGYYAGAGAGEPVRISLPRGGYRPKFERVGGGRADAPTLAENAPPVAPTAASPPPAYVAAAAGLAARKRRPGLRLVAAVASAAVVAAGLVAWLAMQRDFAAKTAVARFDKPPSVVVVLQDDASADKSADAMLDRLDSLVESGLSNFDYFYVRPDASGRAEAGDYTLTGKLAPSGSKYELESRLLRASTGEMVWSRRWPDIDPGDAGAIQALARAIVVSVGDLGSGAIYSDIWSRLSDVDAPLTGYRCILSANKFIRDRNYGRRRSALDCLEAEILVNPDNASALSTLSSLLVVDYLNAMPDSHGALDLRRAVQLAQRAYNLAPQRATSQSALFLAVFYDLRFEDAFKLAHEAMATNPESSLLMARVARAYITRGFYDEGMALLTPMESGFGGLPASSQALLPLVALMRADKDAAYRYALRDPMNLTPMGLITRIVACHEHGDASCAAAAAKKLSDDFPLFASDILASLDRHALSPQIRDRLLGGLTAAGVALAAPVETLRTPKSE